MNSRGFLDHLLRSAQSGLKNVGVLEDDTRGGVGLSEFGKGSLAGGALGLLLGRNRTAGKLAKYGGLAALGVMAWKAHGSWQRERADPAAGAPGQAALGQTAPAATALPAPEPNDADSLILLRALLAAAKSDGHVDAEERARLQQAIDAAGADDELRRWLADELARPLDPADVARGVTDPALAGEIYLLSASAVGTRSYMEQRPGPGTRAGRGPARPARRRGGGLSTR